MKKLNYGIVGCGAISQTHIRALEQIEGARVYGVCSRNQEKAAETAKAAGAKWYPDMGRMLKDSEIDVVLILTASGMHSDMGVEAARAGKHVIVEKPLDISVEKGKKLIAECEKAGVTLNCIFQHRFDEDVITLKEAIAAGRLGALYGGCCHTKWYRTQDYYDQVDWRGTFKLDGGGALMNQGIHQLDLFQYLLGEVEEVFAYKGTFAHERIETEDLCMAVLRFRNGALGLMEASTVARPGFYTRLDLNGEKGTVVLQDHVIKHWKLCGEEERTGHETKDAHRRQLEEITEGIRQGLPTMVSGKEALKSLAVAEAMYRSALSGKPEKVEY